MSSNLTAPTIFSRTGSTAKAWPCALAPAVGLTGRPEGFAVPAPVRSLRWGLGAAVCALSALTACVTPDDPIALFDRGRYDAAFKTFSRLADTGDASAENYLGVHYYLGVGVNRDFGTAARWFERAAVRGHAGAQRNLGILFLRGLGVPQDNLRAYGWFYEAYVQGNRRARPYLRYVSDLVTPNQTMKARAWVRDYIEQAGKPRDREDRN